MPKENKGWHHYPTVENEHYMSGTADIYYGVRQYHELRGKWLQFDCEKYMHLMDKHFDRLQYVIYKNEVPPGRRHDLPYGEIILLDDNGLMLDWNEEIEKGLDQIYISHLWQNPGTFEGAYRFANGVSLEPIGRVFWTAPDLFYWRRSQLREGEKYYLGEAA